eukprot:SAG25_NODE_1119_length_3893_cov_4.745124_1_plen_130_part_00
MNAGGGPHAGAARPPPPLEDTYYNCNRQILQFSELWHFIFVTSRLVTANVSPWSRWESLCYQRLTYIQYSRYVHETVTLPPFCMADSPNLAKSCSLAILIVFYSLLSHLGEHRVQLVCGVRVPSPIGPK